MCLPEQSARDAALAELARLDPAALDAARLMDQIGDLARFISQAQGQLSCLTATLDATGGAAEAGHKSASAFLRTRCGLAPGRAAGVVATARGLRDLEATEKALHAGVISFDQAQVIVRVAGDLHLHHHYFIHLLGWTITGNPNATLHFTHPGGWLTLDSPLPGTDRTQLPDVA